MDLLTRLIRRRILLSFAASILLIGAFGGLLASGANTRHDPFQAHPHQQAIEKKLSSERIADLVEHLPDLDDTLWASALLSNIVVLPSSYEYCRTFVTRLSRVRKLLEDGQSDPTYLKTLLKEKLLYSVKDFQAAKDALRAEMRKGKSFSEPPEYEKKRVYAVVSVYLLGEFSAFETLPILVQVYETKELLPVNRIFVFAVLHELALTYPKGQLTPEVAKVLEDYLAFSKDLPKAEKTSVTAWSATHDETDFRSTILKKDIGLDKQPKITLRIYSKEMIKYENMTNLEPTLELDSFFQKLKTFVVLAYPK